MFVCSLDFQLLQTLKRGCSRLDEDASRRVVAFVQSQMLADESFCNRGGRSDLYYTMFGWMMCYALGIDTDNGKRKAYLSSINVEELDGLHKTAYQQCLLLNDLLGKGLWRAVLKHWQDRHHMEAFMSQFVDHTLTQTLNGTAAKLFSKAKNQTASHDALQYICSLQDPTGGFLSSEGAAIPDLLSTAVALFTLSAYHLKPNFKANDFIEVHFQEDGSFMPNLIDQESDVEYSFYGILATGAA